ncbi:MAG: PfkB family carbohydrate kinase [Candidatus Zhuqueibacterota bacterium]
MDKIFDIAIMGNYTKDTIISSTGTRIVDGGGFNYGAHVAAMMGLNVAAITRLACQDSHVVDRLEKLGVTVFVTVTPQSTFLRLEYPTDNVDERKIFVTQTAGQFTPEEVNHIHARAFLINASTRGEVGFDVVQTLKQKQALIVADVQGFVRMIGADTRLYYDSWEEKVTYLPLIDILKTDAVEAEMLTGERDIKKAAKKLAALGPKEIVLTHQNGVLVRTDGHHFEARFFPEKLIGRSGRGDTCVSAYVAKRLTDSPDAATIWAAAVTSLKMEAEGPILRTVADVQRLIEQKYS